MAFVEVLHILCFHAIPAQRVYQLSGISANEAIFIILQMFRDRC